MRMKWSGLICGIVLAVTVLGAPKTFAQVPVNAFVKTQINPAAANSSVAAMKDFDRLYLSVKGGRAADKSMLKATSARALQDARNLQTSARQLMTDLKSQNKWNKDFDVFVENSLRKAGADERAIAYIRELGGMRSVLEKHSTPAAVEELRVQLDGKLKAVGADRASLLDVLLPSAHAKCIRCHCAWYAVAAGVLVTIPGAQGAAIGAAAAGLACVSNIS